MSLPGPRGGYPVPFYSRGDKSPKSPGDKSRAALRPGRAAIRPPRRGQEPEKGKVNDDSDVLYSPGGGRGAPDERGADQRLTGARHSPGISPGAAPAPAAGRYWRPGLEANASGGGGSDRHAGRPRPANVPASGQAQAQPPRPASGWPRPCTGSSPVPPEMRMGARPDTPGRASSDRRDKVLSASVRVCSSGPVPAPMVLDGPGPGSSGGYRPVGGAGFAGRLRLGSRNLPSGGMNTNRETGRPLTLEVGQPVSLGVGVGEGVQKVSPICLKDGICFRRCQILAQKSPRGCTRAGPLPIITQHQARGGLKTDITGLAL